MKSAKKIVKGMFHALGFEITRLPPPASPTDLTSLGVDPFRDISNLIHKHPPVITFDVGGNIGQSVKLLKGILPESQLHSFEPSPTTYQLLAQNAATYSDVYLNNVAVGSSSGSKTFIEYSHSVMNSFLQQGEHPWGEVVNETPVQITTLDKYCEENDVPYISLLKNDTQGYEFEVLKGAKELMASNRIQLIFMEIIWVPMYKNLPAFDEIYRFLVDNKFQLVSFYEFHHYQGQATWSDALFINPNFEPQPPFPAV